MSDSTVVKLIELVPDRLPAKRGRPLSSDSLVFVTVGLARVQWAWLSLWFPTGSTTDALRSLLDRAMKFWPAGPYAFGHSKKTGGLK